MHPFTRYYKLGKVSLWHIKSMLNSTIIYYVNKVHWLLAFDALEKLRAIFWISKIVCINLGL